MTWTGQTFSVGQILTAAQMNNLQADITALANGDTGAPDIVQAALGSNCVGQGQLKVALQQTSGSGTNYYAIGFTGGVYTLGWGIAAASGTPQVRTYNTAAYTAGIGIGDTGSFTYYFQAYYFQASPPYNLGYGDIPLFIFAVIDRTTGIVERIDTAEDAPWHYNGPTSVKADIYKSGKAYRKVTEAELNLIESGEKLEAIPLRRRIELVRKIRESPKDSIIEMTQSIKNADMDIVPHPFIDSDLTGKSIVLLDPCCDDCLDIVAMRNMGEKIDVNFMNKYLVIGNSPLSVKSPIGVHTVHFRWKNTI